MSSRRKQKKRGRPGPGAASLSRDEIVQAANRILLAGEAVSIRRIAAALGVDPMALYHHFKNKRDLLEAVCMLHISGIYTTKRSRYWKSQLMRLARSYVAVLIAAPELIETLISMGPPHGPATYFGEQFSRAAPEGLSRRKAEGSLHLLVDYIHGFALASRYVPRSGPAFREYMRSLAGALQVYIAGVEAVAGNRS